MKALKIILCASILNLAALLVIVLKLPETVPVHLNMNMMVDRYGSRWIILILGLVPLAFSAIRIIFPLDKAQNEKVNTVLNPLIAAFLIVITWIPVLIAVQYGQSLTKPLNIPLDFIIVFPFGILIIILSNYMGVIKRSVWMGIRIYWTLADETVWKKTHRLGGITGVIGGFIICAFAVAGLLLKSPAISFTGIFIGVILLAVVPTVYSYLLYKKLHPKPNPPTH